MNRNKRLFVKTSNEKLVERGLVVSPSSIFSNLFILPGFVDVHVHLREPGFLYKETIETGTMAAAAGGFTDIFSMPNLNPCPDSNENLQVQLDAIEQDARVNVYPYGAITTGQKGNELAQMDEISDKVIAFTDDGFGVASDEMMREAMIEAKALGKIIVAHCEDENYPKESSEAEWKQLERDLNLVRETGCRYHVCHISTKESVQLVRRAKAEGLPVTCETAPHYLVLNREFILDEIARLESLGDEEGLMAMGRFKMNPPIKFEEDQKALIEAIKDNTIDMIATDHAPHSYEEKHKGFYDSAFGIVGLETALPVMYTELVDKGIIDLTKLMELMYLNPRKIFGLKVMDIDDMIDCDNPTYTLWALDEEYVVNPEDFLSKGKSSPFEGRSVKGRCLKTVIDGRVVYERD